MSGEEAIKIMMNEDLCVQRAENCDRCCGNCDLLMDADKIREAYRTTISALKDYGEYRWHDLRRNPEDLPEQNEEVLVTWVNHHPVDYYKDIVDIPFTAAAVHKNGEFWWYSVRCRDMLMEYVTSPGDEIDENVEVMAWMRFPHPYREREDGDEQHA